MNDQATKAREEISKGESAIWADGTKYTPEELESAYESHVTNAVEAGDEPKDFATFCQEDLDISNE